MKSFNHILILALFTALGFTACNYNNEFHEVKIDNSFSVAVPSWMKKQDDLKPDAPFQYANRYRNVYAIAEILPAGVDEFPATASAVIGNVKNALEAPLVTDSVAVQINGLQGVRVELYGKMSGENVYFTEVLLNGSNKTYHLSIWTRAEERKLRFKEDINQMVASFKPL